MKKQKRRHGGGSRIIGHEQSLCLRYTQNVIPFLRDLRIRRKKPQCSAG